MTRERQSEYRLRRRVQFHKVDGAGLVHFSCFFRDMEEAEHAFEFHKPLRFEDEFDVHIRITEIGEKTIRYACDVMRADLRIATGTMAIASRFAPAAQGG